jgi:Cu(I)/Ag(I) efflux system membrane fusion protein
VGDVIDLETRTAQVRVIVDRPDIPLRPGQSLLAKIHTSAPVAASLVVPRGAVISVDGKQTLFIAHDALSVEPRTVQLGGQDGDRVEIVGGLEEGEKVAISGVFALKSEIFR